MKSIAFFSTKGGVGKTTLCCNLASFLAKECGLRVLLVDMDSQINASQYLLPYEQLSRYYSDAKHFSLHAYFESTESSLSFQARVPDIVHVPNSGIDLMPGDPLLMLQEDKLALAWNEGLNGSVAGLHTILAFKHLLEQVSDRYDFVFIDMAPTIGPLNRMTLLASDYFMIPVAPDRLSFLALQNVINFLIDWQIRINAALEAIEHVNDQQSQLNNKGFRSKLSLIGFVQTRFNTVTFKGETHTVQAHEAFQKALENELSGLARQFGFRDFRDALLGSLPNLGSLLATSALANVPVFALGKREGVIGAQFARIDDTRVLFGEIASNLLKRVADRKGQV